MTARALVVVAYAVLAASAIILQLVGRAGRLGLVPLSTVVDAVLVSRTGRLVVAVVWAWVGWHLLAR
jgi:Family of unknown function (DUF6186)